MRVEYDPIANAAYIRIRETLEKLKLLNQNKFLMGAFVILMNKTRLWELKF